MASAVPLTVLASILPTAPIATLAPAAEAAYTATHELIGQCGDLLTVYIDHAAVNDARAVVIEC